MYAARRMYWRLLRENRDFRLLYAGSLISLGGDWFLTVALLDLVLQLTGSAMLASLMLLCSRSSSSLHLLVHTAEWRQAISGRLQDFQGTLASIIRRGTRGISDLSGFRHRT